MNKQQWRGNGRIIAAILFFCILALVGFGRAADTGSLPATNWNLENLNKIQAAKTADPLTFAVLGDNRGHPEILGQVLKLIDDDPSLPFAIHLGDTVKEGDLEQYHPFFKAVRQNLHKPMLTVIGNHELKSRGLILYRDIFGPDHYSFQLNGHYFIVTNDAPDEGPSEAEVRWLETELQKAQSYKTRLVFLHVPLYDPRKGQSHALPSEAASRLLALFKKYKVTHIFAAHIHSYYADVREDIPIDITGGAGAPPPETGKDPEHDFYHYLKVSIQGDRVQIQVQRLPQSKSP